MFFFNPVACCFLYKHRDLSAFSYGPDFSFSLVDVNFCRMVIVISYEVLKIGQKEPGI
jgi:hypothetical protein